MRHAAFRVALLATLMLAAPQAFATVCMGPDLSNITVLPDKSLEVHGYGGVARSADGGRSWRTVPGRKASGKPFWKREFRGPRGARYQNIVMNKEHPIAIVSQDGGRTWEHFAAPAQYELILWADAGSRFILYGNELSMVLGTGASPGRGFLDGQHPAHYGEIYDHAFVALEFQGRELFTRSVERQLVSRRDGIEMQSLGSLGADQLGAAARIEVGQLITGFFVDGETIYISAENRILRGNGFGQSWEALAIPEGWISCNGDPPRPSPQPR